MANLISGGATISQALSVEGFQRVAEGQVALNLTVEVPALDLKELLAALEKCEVPVAFNCPGLQVREASPKAIDCDLSPKSDHFPTFDPFEQTDEIEGRGESCDLALQEIDAQDSEAEIQKPVQVSASSLKVLRRHSSWVNGVAWAADQENKENEKIVTGSSNHTACIWKPSGLTQWKAIKTLRGSTEGFRALAWSPDCSRLVAAGMENEALVYNVSGPEHRQWEASGVLRGHTDVLRAVSWSPCGRKVLTGGDDKTARIWKASRMDASWEQVAVLNGHCESVRAVAWRPDPDKLRTHRVVLACGLSDSTIVLWTSAPHDRRQFEVLATLAGHCGAVRSLDWSWDGTLLASGSSDATTRIWHCDGWQEVAKLEVGTCAGVKAVAWSPDGRKLATGGADAILRVWTRGDLHQWNLGAELTGHQAAIRSLCWSPEGSKVLTGSADRTARIWRVD